MKYSYDFLDRVSAACHQAALDGRLRHRPAVEPEDDPHFQAAIRKFCAEQARKQQDADPEVDPDDPSDAGPVPKLG